MQGFVVDQTTGVALNGRHDVTFYLYNTSSPEAGDEIWEVTKTIRFREGTFQTYIQPSDALIQASSTLCIGVQIEDDDEMTPCLEFYKTPWSYYSDKSGSALTAAVAEKAQSLHEDYLSIILDGIVGDGVLSSAGKLELDTTSKKTWLGAQTYKNQLNITSVATTADPDRVYFEIKDKDGTEIFTVTEDGDVVVTGTISSAGSNLGVGNITGVTAPTPIIH